MEITRFRVEDRAITQENDVKLIGMVGQDKFQVNFVDDAWQGLHKTMKLIRADGSIVYLIMDNDEVELTQECYVEGTAQLGFFGTINENEPEEMKIASTDYIPIYFNHHAYSTDSGEAINVPTPTQWDIIIGQMNEVRDDIAEMQDDVTEKVESFDDNYTQKINAFNSNATSKTNAFNTNATNKTNAFNNNYTAKVGEVNQIIDDFKDYVETVDYNYNNLENKPQTWNALTGDVD